LALYQSKCEALANKVFGQAFYKKLAGFGTESQGLNRVKVSTCVLANKVFGQAFCKKLVGFGTESQGPFALKSCRFPSLPF